MDEKKLTETIFEMNKKLTEVHTIVYKNGLVRAVEKQAKDTADLRQTITDFVINRESTCPIKIEMDERAKERRGRFDSRLIIYGLVIGGISALPDIIKLF
jgi:hypothetical protein